MKYHPSLTRLYVLNKGPQAMALMIASEFGRAANRSEHRDNVMKCYSRARELMGILETLLLPVSVSQRLEPWYEKCQEIELLSAERLQPSYVQQFCTQAAVEFNQAAQLLS